MIIISHRGFWRTKKEMNTPEALVRSFKEGFGTETDLRDQDGQLVISHDVPRSACLSFQDFMRLYLRWGRGLPLALNVKSDGLHDLVETAIRRFRVRNYFLFDMSVPDMRVYVARKLKVFSRQSEYEPQPAFYNAAQGIWLDEFESHWITQKEIRRHHKARKAICIVSPELHKRSYLKAWKDYRAMERKVDTKELAICTDFPDRARAFFADVK